MSEATLTAVPASILISPKQPLTGPICYPPTSPPAPRLKESGPAGCKLPREATPLLFGFRARNHVSRNQWIKSTRVSEGQTKYWCPKKAWEQRQLNRSRIEKGSRESFPHKHSWPRATHHRCCSKSRSSARWDSPTLLRSPLNLDPPSLAEIWTPHSIVGKESESFWLRRWGGSKTRAGVL